MRKFTSILLCFLLVMSQLWAQNKSLTGKVVDDKGNAVANASILVKGTAIGTTTDAAGNFKLTVPPTAKTLVISSLNFEAQEITIGSKTSFSVSLKSAVAEQIDDVVVTGISRVKKSQFSGAVTKVVAKELEDRPVGSFDQLLQGRVPGLLALNGSGQPGNASTIIIRGQGSISGGSAPLYVIDGIPVEEGVFQGMNQNDFASIDVLRDAATQALYGSRGSAGVIVITTKRGTPGKIKIGYSGQFGIKSKPEFSFKPMNTTQLLQAQYDYGKVVGSSANTNASIPGWFFSKDNPRYATLTAADKAIADRSLDSISKISTNWYDEFFRTGSFSNHELSISGGTGKTRIFSSIGYYNEKGLIDPSDMRRVTFRNNLDYADDKFTLSVSTGFGYTKRNFDPAFPGYIFNSFLTPNIQSPYSKVYDANGGLLLAGTVGNSTYFGAQLLDIKKKDMVYNDQLKATIGTTLSYKITKHLTASLAASIDFRETNSSTYNSREAYIRTPASGQGSLTQLAGAMSESISRFLTSNARPSLTYNNLFAGKHDLEVTALGEYVQEDSKGIGFTGFGIDPRTPNTAGVVTQGNSGNQLYAQIPAVNNSRYQNTIASVLGMFRYTYNGKYTLTGSYRRDGSSKLPTENRWVGFYSVGGIWEVTKEKFAQPNKTLNSLRVRASYGVSGNHNNFPSDYLYQSTYGTGTYSGLSTQVATYPGNPDAKWESTYTLNLGVDFQLFNNRVYGDLNWYDKRTKDLYVTRQTSPQGGGFSIDVNAGELQNTGFEWNVNVDVVRNKNITWTVFATGGYNKNKLLDLGGVTPYESGTSFLQVGLPLGSHYEVKWGGVDAATGQPLYYTKDGVLTNVYNTSNSVTDFGTWEAPWKGGFGTSVKYRSFDLSVLFSWQQGANKVDNLEYFVENPVGFLASGFNQSTSLNFWKKPGDITSTPSPLYGANFSSKIFHDASFLRLRDITLSYSLPNSILTKAGIANAKFFVQGTNLFMWTKWRGMDPEAGAVNLNLSEFPNPRAFTAGFKVTF